MKRTLDEAKWNDKLTAHIVKPGDAPTIHGYDVENDLVRHYSFIETILLTYTGELPTPEQALAFDIVMQFIAPSPVNEAPTHAAILARTCGTDVSSIIPIAAIALAEQARDMINRHSDWVIKLTQSHYAINEITDGEIYVCSADSISAFNVYTIPDFDTHIREQLILTTLNACGLKTSEQMQCAIVMAKLSSTMAEALATKPCDIKSYPVHLPPMEYDI